MTSRTSMKLLKKRNKYLRVDVLPFLIMYPLLIGHYLFLVEEEIMGRVSLLGLVIGHVITYLSSHWSVRWKVFNQYDQTIDIQQASCVLVTYYRPNHPTIYELVSIHHPPHPFSPVVYFHSKKFIYDPTQQQFNRLKPSLHLPLQQYADQQLNYQTNHNLFDDNELNIPIRTFNQLLKDQLLEPFSFFQFFSVSLWLLDENRFYSLLTLGMLFMTSCTVTLQRIRTMMTLRQMKLNPCLVNVMKGGKWQMVNSCELKPGDIIQIDNANQTLPSLDVNQQQKDQQFYKQIVPFSHKLPPQFFQTEQINTNSHKKVQCDILLLQGNAIVDESILTGESVPQIKDQITNQHFDKQLDIKNTQKNNIIFCGTEVIQTFNQNGQKCIGRVLRTGFDTSKGKLIRTVLFNNENMNIKQYDAFILIGILLLLSILSSGYVLYQGLQDPSRDRNKLFLRCILIVTTVVPPELPMILTIAVNGSLMYLQAKKIFCSEPFRIPLAGQVQLLAFDKTGTLTIDQLKFKGIVEPHQLTRLSHSPYVLTQLAHVNKPVQLILAGCHSLLVQNREVIGDPLEKLFFQHSDWQYSNLNKVSIQKQTRDTVEIKKQFYFQSELKRMTTIAETTCDGKKELKVLTKGAPEMIQKLLKEQSEMEKQEYNECYKELSGQGMRVLALASRTLSYEWDDAQGSRESYEQQLTFQGFLVCESLLKWDTKQHLDMLRRANFSTIIITGDNLLTAVAVAKQLQFFNHTYYTLTTTSQGLVIKRVKEKEREEEEKVDKTQLIEYINRIEKGSLLAMDGECLQWLQSEVQLKVLRQVLQKVQVYGRTSPSQKEYIVTQLRKAGLGVLMCGDGTNDVGALKKADVGIALVGFQEEDSLEKHQKRKQLQKQQKQQALQPRRPNQTGEVNNSIGNLQDMLGEEYKFGDACIAAPFTSKQNASIRCVAQVLKQGICTQVTSIQTYKILTLTSIISAYSFTMLHLQSLKFSESQSTITGILMTVNYFYFSNTKPLKEIQGVRPSKTIFEPYFLTSVVSQLCIHLYAMEYSFQLGLKYDDQGINHDEQFKPTFLNTVAFFVNFVSQQCIFLFNHGGLPFSQPLSQNKKYLKWLIYPLIAALFISQNVNDNINWFLELHYENVPQEALSQLFSVMLSVIVLNYIVEFSLKYIKYRKVYDYI